jgi:hypothetical protein
MNRNALTGTLPPELAAASPVFRLCPGQQQVHGCVIVVLALSQHGQNLPASPELCCLSMQCTLHDVS